MGVFAVSPYSGQRESPQLPAASADPPHLKVSSGPQLTPEVRDDIIIFLTEYFYVSHQLYFFSLPGDVISDDSKEQEGKYSTSFEEFNVSLP